MVLSNNKDKINGFKIYCHGHKVYGLKRQKQRGKDKHKEDSVKIKSGSCLVLIPDRWEKNKRLV